MNLKYKVYFTAIFPHINGVRFGLYLVEHVCSYDLKECTASIFMVTTWITWVLKWLARKECVCYVEQLEEVVRPMV
jgi:hypothetical protein